MSTNTTDFWTLEEARELCVEIERLAAMNGYHVALTGGLLYRQGPRKDLDLIFYKLRNGGKRVADDSDYDRLLTCLRNLGITVFYYPEAWKRTGQYFGKSIDLLFPDED